MCVCVLSKDAKFRFFSVCGARIGVAGLGEDDDDDDDDDGRRPGASLCGVIDGVLCCVHLHI